MKDLNKDHGTEPEILLAIASISFLVAVALSMIN